MADSCLLLLSHEQLGWPARCNQAWMLRSLYDIIDERPGSLGNLLYITTHGRLSAREERGDGPGYGVYRRESRFPEDVSIRQDWGRGAKWKIQLFITPSACPERSSASMQVLYSSCCLSVAITVQMNKSQYLSDYLSKGLAP